MAAAKENLTIENGITYEKTWVYADADRVPISLAAYEARMQIRERIDSPNFIVELTSTVGGINLELGGETGRIDIRIAANVTETFSFDRAVYDLEIYKPADATTVYRLVGGSVILKGGVTR
jgi:hypothetical protein